MQRGRHLSAAGSLTSQDSTGGQRPHQRTRPVQRNIQTKNAAEPDACMCEAPEIRRRWDGDPCCLGIGLLWTAPTSDVVEDSSLFIERQQCCTDVDER